LIWVLEPYIVMTKGVLQESSTDTASVSSFPALKILYKVYQNRESANADPRTSGADSSIGIFELPLGCCLNFQEMLLSNSHSLPPTCRAVGQFYVGYLRLKECVE